MESDAGRALVSRKTCLLVTARTAWAPRKGRLFGQPGKAVPQPRLCRTGFGVPEGTLAGACSDSLGPLRRGDCPTTTSVCRTGFLACPVRTRWTGLGPSEGAAVPQVRRHVGQAFASRKTRLSRWVRTCPAAKAPAPGKGRLIFLREAACHLSCGQLPGPLDFHRFWGIVSKHR